MKLIRSWLIFAIAFMVFSCVEHPNTETESTALSLENKQPTVSFTFDDGITKDIAGFKFPEWNGLLLNALETANLRAIFFVTGFNKTDERGKYLLNEWNLRNLGLANHTFTHPNFNDKRNTPDVFIDELLMTDSIINRYENYIKLFRFPYLKEGESAEKVNAFRSILNTNGYRNGYVTIDASDWYINTRLINQLKYQENVDTLAFQAFYLEHIIERAKYYESLSYEMNDRHISHTLLLHHNLTSALFLSALIEAFESEGWAVINATEAYQDPIYDSMPSTVPAGESLIWSLAKESGNFEGRLRYPAEDSRYEKDKMDKLNL